VLDDLLKQLLASNFAYYLKAHYFHWNVEGSDFVQYHTYFGDLYGELWGAVDTIAEHIRILGVYAPGSLSRFSQLSVIDDQINIPTSYNTVMSAKDSMVKFNINILEFRRCVKYNK
jgi:starvation-inducible DNA-binding protein